MEEGKRLRKAALRMARAEMGPEMDAEMGGSAFSSASAAFLAASTPSSYGQEKPTVPTNEHVCKYPPDNNVPAAFSWLPVVCNDQLFLLNQYSQGKGRDIFWPSTGISREKKKKNLMLCYSCYCVIHMLFTCCSDIIH